MPLHQLPGEILLQIFGYLDVIDKHSVRSTCTYLKEFVDCGLLWKNWTPALKSSKRYSCDFWKMLRRRKLTKVVMRSHVAKDWVLLARYLPSITTLVMDKNTNDIFDSLKNFSQLKHLAVRGAYSFISPNLFTLPQAERLTHLSMCNVFFKGSSERFISALAVFTNLRSLVCHGIVKNGDLSTIIHLILCSFPRLRHLSWCCTPAQGALRVPEHSPLEGEHPLSSLELDMFHDSITQGVMEMMPNLDTLVLRYDDKTMFLRPSSENLQNWLRGLRHLSSLAITSGPCILHYIRAIPTSLSSLTYCSKIMTLEDIRNISKILPNLIHLHVDSYQNPCMYKFASYVPSLFPKLQSISLCGEGVPDDDILDFQEMENLKYVEILNTWPPFPKLVAKFQEVTDNQIQIKTSYQEDSRDCQCYREGLTGHRITSKNICE